MTKTGTEPAHAGNTYNDTYGKRRWTTFFTHLIVLCLIFLLPELLMTYAHPRWKLSSAYMVATYLKTAVYVLVFYAEYHLVLSQSLLSSNKSKAWRIAAYNLLLFIAAMAAIYSLYHFFFCHAPNAPHHHHHHPGHASHYSLMVKFISFLLRDSAVVVLTMGLAAALRLSSNFRKLRRSHERLVAMQKADELQSLKNQLNPHFLFNSLNTIYALIAIDPSKAQASVHELSTLLRYCLYENPEKVPISQEVGFLRSYLSLMETRIGPGKVVADICIEGDPEVAPLLFLPLVENAFKHGRPTSQSEPIMISLSASPEQGISFTITNPINPAGHSGSPGKEGGIGIANLKRRLQLIYASDATLTTGSDGSTYTASLSIQPQPQA